MENTVAISGDFVANGNLLFSKNYNFLWKLMIKANARYTGVGWNSLGPVLLTDVIRKIEHFYGDHKLFSVNTSGISVIWVKARRSRCSDITRPAIT